MSNKNAKFIFANSAQIFKSRNIKKRVNEKSEFHKFNDYTKFRYDIFQYLKKMKKIFKLRFINLILFNHDSRFRNSKFLILELLNMLKMKILNH